MSNPIPISSPVVPDLRSQLDSFRQEVNYTLFCHLLGTIVSFDAAKQTASVQVSILKTQQNQQIPYPVLTDCPVYTMSGGVGCVTVPVAAGDPCLVLFHDRDIDNWFSTGPGSAPNSGRSHSLSDGLVLVGFRNATNPIGSFSTTDVELRNLSRSGSVGVGSNGKISVRNTSGSLLSALDSLMTALDGLCNNLTAWVNTGGSTPNPATVAAITLTQSSLSSVKTSIYNLLK